MNLIDIRLTFKDTPCFLFVILWIKKYFWTFFQQNIVITFLTAIITGQF